MPAKVKTEQHLKILRAARDGVLPKIITPSCVDFSFQALRELCDERLMTADYQSAIQADERQYSNPQITLPGREYLAKSQLSWRGKLWQETSVKLVASVIVALVLAALTWALA